MVRFEQCFNGILDTSEIEGKQFIFIPPASQHPGGALEVPSKDRRIFARYDDTLEAAFNKELSGLVSLTPEDSSAWTWHPIVELSHLKKLYPEPQAQFLFDYQIPTVLIDLRAGHKDYNLSHAFGANLTFSMPKEDSVFRGAERARYLFSMKTLYSQVYRQDLLLKKIAVNIIDRL